MGNDSILVFEFYVEFLNDYHTLFIYKNLNNAKEKILLKLRKSLFRKYKANA